jgi:hypothetical protein
MKCKACNTTLSSQEQKWDPRRRTLEDMCSVCLHVALHEDEQKMLKLAMFINDNDDWNIPDEYEEEPNSGEETCKA